MADPEYIAKLKEGVEAWNSWTEENILGFLDLSEADLIRADLNGANLNGANLKDTDLHNAVMFDTALTDIDLRSAKGLEDVHHRGPSSIGIDTIYKSKGNIPRMFLKRAGVPDIFIEYMSSFTGKEVGLNSCFISYSSKDQDFADCLYADLQNKGVRCWFAPEDMKIGDKIRDRIDKANTIS